MRHEIIKEYFEKGIFTKEDLAIFVEAEYVTSIQYGEMAGEAYAKEPRGSKVEK